MSVSSIWTLSCFWILRKLLKSIFNCILTYQSLHSVAKNINMCSDQTYCPSICTRMIVYKNDPTLYDMLDYNRTKDAELYSCDQDYLLTKIQNPVKYFTIVRNACINGCYPSFRETKIIVPKETCTVHFFYLYNYMKKYKIILQGMWYLKQCCCRRLRHEHDRTVTKTREQLVRFCSPLTIRTLMLIPNKNRWYYHRHIIDRTHTIRHKQIQETGVVAVVVVVYTERSSELIVYRTTVI